MKMRIAWGAAVAALGLGSIGSAQEISVLPKTLPESRWFSFENRSGAKGQAASTNHQAKGNAWEPIKAHESKVLMNYDGCGTIRRMWFTFRPWEDRALRSLVIQIYWDHSQKPAVEVPFGDFFSQGLAHPVAFQNALFSNPEGRSVNCYVPMPFRTGARVVLKNESSTEVGLLFYDIDITKEKSLPSGSAYFHAFWKRDFLTDLGQDYELLPKVVGRGRYLGATLGVEGNPMYENAGWGEGEVKVYMDGDRKLPTLSGTGTEDYIGTGWGMGVFSNQYQGCTVSDNDKHCWAFYRFHLPEPVYFNQSCRVTIQDIGGDGTENVRKLIKQGAEVKPVSAAADEGLVRLLDRPGYPKIGSSKFPLDAWVNFYRRDDYSSVAYFYLDRPVSNLPRLASVEVRTARLRYK